MRRTLLAGSVLALTPLAAFATQSSMPDPSESAPRAPGYFDVMDAFEQWSEANGGLWRVHYEKRTQAARLIFGGSTPGSFVPSSDDDYFVLAREFLAETYGMHRIDPSTLVEDRVVFLPLGQSGSTDKMTVRFEQHVNGVSVLGGSVNVLFDTKGRLLSIDVEALPELEGFKTLPAYGGAEAQRAAARLFRADAGVDPTHLSQGELKVLIHLEGKHFQPRLIWDVNAQWLAADFTEEGYHYRLDAIHGELLDRRDSVHFLDVSGTVTSMATPGTDPDDGSNSAALNMPYITVTSPQGNAVADVDGNFNIVGATAPVNVTIQYDGTYAVTDDNTGGEYSITTSLGSASGNVVTMNPTAPEFDTAEANAYNWIGLMRNWTVTTNPADTMSDFQAFANVNQSSTCNATWSGSAVNFRAVGGGCVNSAYSSVVLHEMGHWMNDRYGSGNGSDGFGEGNADSFSIHILDDPIIAKDFFGPGQPIRDAENSNTWCGNGCYGQVHADGEVLMGAQWNVRKNFKSTYGTVAGGVAVNTLFNAWMNAYDDGSITPTIRDHWLVLDDDNGNINDGTPNFDDINDGFVTQGFPPFVLPFVIYSNVVEPQDTQNEIGPYTVQADVVANFNPPLAGITMNYRVGGGAFTPVAMSFVSGDTYTADIPGQISPTAVEWYIDASDNSANSNTFPAGAPGALKKFEIGELTVYYTEDFESGANGWTHGLNTQQDDWQRSADVGATNGSFGKAGDATSAFSGTQIWGNDLGPSGWNGFYQDNVDNWLRSPSIDLSAATGSKLRFQRWLTVEDGQFDQARVLLNGTEVWVNPNGADTIDTSWNEVEVDVSAFDGNPNVVIEFKMESDSSTNFGGWNLDDVQFVSLNASSGGGITYCTAGTSGSGCQALISAAGVASATSASGFTLQATTVEGDKDGLFFFGPNGKQANQWGNGTSFQCVVPPVLRGGTMPGVGTIGGCDGTFTQDLNALWCPGCPKPQKNPGAGAVVQAQLWYRDPFSSSSQTTSLSDAVEFIVSP